MVRAFLGYFWTGLRFGYPLCCILQWSFIAARAIRKNQQAYHRGVLQVLSVKRFEDEEGEIGSHPIWVPCFFHQQIHPLFTTHETI